MQMTWADKIEAKGIAKGREEGVDLLRRTLLLQLDQRFGKVPEALQERLASIRSFAKLNAIAGKILKVQSIEELGLGG